MFLEDVIVLENINISNNYFLLKVLTKKLCTNAKAGQFFMIKSNDNSRILRRPISLHNIDGNILEFYYEALGSGTYEISNLRPNDVINIHGSLGNGFSTTPINKNIVVIGGGIGIAPMKYLIKSLLPNNNITFIAGASDSHSIKIVERFNFPNVHNIITTLDGSTGITGNVIDALNPILEKNNIDLIYTCGPFKMMEAVARLSHKHNILCEISLEERMACGIKACVGCSIITKNGMKKVCYDGPVFNSLDIIEENIGGTNE